MKIPADIKAALAECPFPFEIKTGRRHAKLVVQGRLLGTFTCDGKMKGPIGHLAIVKRIRAVATEGKGGAA